jgi:hypothetical protein
MTDGWRLPGFWIQSSNSSIISLHRHRSTMTMTMTMIRVCVILLVALLLLSTTAKAFLVAPPRNIAGPLLLFHDASASFDAPSSAATAGANFFDTTTLPSLADAQNHLSIMSSHADTATAAASVHSHSFFFLLSLDFGAQASDGVRTAVFGVVGVLLFLAAASTYIAQAVVPEQMNNMALMVQESKPEIWDEITSQLQEGERVRDRPDLMTQLTDAAVDLMKDETEEELKRLAIMIRAQKDFDMDGMEALRENIEGAVGCTIDEFVQRVEANKDSKFLSAGRRELAELLQVEFDKTSDDGTAL